MAGAMTRPALAVLAALLLLPALPARAAPCTGAAEVQGIEMGGLSGNGIELRLRVASLSRAAVQVDITIPPIQGFTPATPLPVLGFRSPHAQSVVIGVVQRGTATGPTIMRLREAVTISCSFPLS